MGSLPVQVQIFDSFLYEAVVKPAVYYYYYLFLYFWFAKKHFACIVAAPSNSVSGCVRVHYFRVPPSLGGSSNQSVMMESPNGGSYVSAQTGARGSSSLGVTVTSSTPDSVTSLDSRFFNLIPSEAERLILVHQQTGKLKIHECFSTI